MDDKSNDDLWYWYLTGKKRASFPEGYERAFDAYRKVYRLFPGHPRCFECDIPMAGLAGILLRPWGSRPSSFNSRFCSHCETFARSCEAGAEVELTLLFADIRDLTRLAEEIGTSRFKDLIKKFYKVTSDVLIQHNAMVNHLMGDQVIGLFVPRFSGTEHARVAIQAARDMLRVTGHEQPGGPWVPVGIGIHTGMAYVGMVGSSKGVNEIAVLGSAANLAAWFSSHASTGEVLLSAETSKAANLDTTGLKSRLLELKGISNPVLVSVLPPPTAQR